MRCETVRFFVPLLVLAGASPILAVDFAHDIVPILKRHCVTCHGGREFEGEFSINTRESWIESGMIDPGSSDSSRVIQLVISTDKDSQMPPSDRARLSKAEIDLLAKWIDRDLPWEPGFTFNLRGYEPPLRPRKVVLPAPRGDRHHPIDRMLDATLVKNETALPALIDDAAFLRRATLDLVGLLPTVEEFKSFTQETASNKREVLIERLLSREIDYADHWLSFYNDLLRNDYTGTGFITGGRKQITKWLYAALRQNMPFDQMTRELVSPPSSESQGFIDGIRWRGTVSAGQTLPIQFAQSVSQSFLGINLKCASCHDSFIDRWTLKDAYGLAAIYSETPLELHRCDKTTGQTQSAKWLFPELGTVQADAPREEKLRQLAALMTHPDNGRFARTIVNRLWHRMMGRGIVHPLDAMQTEPWNQDLLDYLANQFVENGYDLKATLRLIATSRAYQSKSESRDSPTSSDYVYKGPRQRRLTAEQFMDAVWQLTGAEPKRYDAPIFRATVDEDEIANCEFSASWIWAESDLAPPPGGEEVLMRKTLKLDDAVSEAGAVITCDNEFKLYVGNRFVAGGDDWTKVQLVNLKSRLKKGNNQLVVWVKNGADKPNPAGLFFEARVLLENGKSLTITSDDSWQFNRNVPATREGRLPAPKNGWSPVAKLKALSVWNEALEKTGRPFLAQLNQFDFEQPMNRAALMANTPLMQSLGRPLREQIVSMRPEQLTTLEAIDLANDASLSETLNLGAKRWLERKFSSTDALIEELFQTTLTRRPTPSEQTLFYDALGETPTVESVQDAMWALLMLPEFLFVR